MTKDERAAAYTALPCTREAIDKFLLDEAREQGMPMQMAPEYPDEWYTDKNNRIAGRPTGHLRKEGNKIGWVAHK